MRRAFTLIELLTVLAITAVIMGIIILPMIQSFNFTRSAESFAEAQDRGRQLLDSISRDIANSVGVVDNAGQKGETTVVLPGKDGTPVTLHLRNSRIDILRAAEGDPSATPGVFIDPNTGKVDPTLKSSKGQVVTPVAAGTTLVRYFIGLRFPLSSNGLAPGQYSNPYDGILMKASGQPENLYVLYRAEYQPYVFSGGVLVPNDNLFKRDPNDNTKPYLDDPDFFCQYPTAATVTALERQNQAARVQRWMDNSTIVTSATRYDMILPIFNRATKVVTYDGNNPRVLSLIQFRPTPQSQEPAVGSTAIPLGSETDTADPSDPTKGVASNVFRTSKGSWSGAVIRVTPYDPVFSAASDSEVLDMTDTGPTADYEVILNSSLATPNTLAVFDITAYNKALGDIGMAGNPLPFPFSQAVAAANAASGWLAQPSPVRDKFTPLFLDTHSGQLRTDFDISEVGNPDPSQPIPPDNSPVAPTCGTDNMAWTPENDPNIATGNFYDATFASVNELFNKVWHDNPNVRPNIQRFLDLRIVPMADKWASPFDPAPDGTNRLPWASGWTGFGRGQITPASETIIGPDQRPGPNYGSPIRYSRTTGVPGPNEYRINYVDLAEPADYSTIDSDLAPGTVAPPTYDPTNIVSAILQPRYKLGYVQFDSDPNVPMPLGQIKVHYKFQFNRPGDLLTVDYDSREVMNVLLTVRNFPDASSATPQSITLEAATPIRNFIR